jgi:hypothetical protein
MNSERKSTTIRVILLICGAVILFVVLSPILYFPRTRTAATYTMHHPDVSIDFEPGGAQRIRVDGEEAIVPKDETETHPLAKEAWRRVMDRGGRLGEPEFPLRWSRVVRFWLLPVVLLYFLLFRWWPKKHDYVTGSRL